MLAVADIGTAWNHEPGTPSEHHALGVGIVPSTGAFQERYQEVRWEVKQPGLKSVPLCHLKLALLVVLQANTPQR